MQQTSNYGLNKPEQTDTVNIDDLNANFDTLDTELKKVSDKANLIQTAGGTGTAITLTNVNLVNGFTITFVVVANNNGAATTINGKSLYKPGGTAAPTLTAGKAVTVWYNGTNFFIKASAEGNAVAADVLAGKTFSNDNDTGLTGTMANNGPASAETVNLTTAGAEYTIPVGYHSGLRKIKAAITNIAAAVIKAGTTVGGIVGTFTADATATAAQMLSGVTAYVNGNKITGTIVSKPAATYNPSTSAQTIAAGQYLSGTQTIAATIGTAAAGDVLSGKTFNSANGIGLAGTMTWNTASNGVSPVSAAFHVHGDTYSESNGSNTFMLVPKGYWDGNTWLGINMPGLKSSNILSGVEIGTDTVILRGGIPNRSTEDWHQPALESFVSSANGYGAYVRPPAGYYDGNSWVRSLQPDMVPANILAGKSIFGVTGTAIAGKRFASGSGVTPSLTATFYFEATYSNGYDNYYYVNLSTLGLAFTPSVVIFYVNTSYYDSIIYFKGGFYQALNSTPLRSFATSSHNLIQTNEGVAAGFGSNYAYSWYAWE